MYLFINILPNGAFLKEILLTGIDVNELSRTGLTALHRYGIPPNYSFSLLYTSLNRILILERLPGDILMS